MKKVIHFEGDGPGATTTAAPTTAAAPTPTTTSTTRIVETYHPRNPRNEPLSAIHQEIDRLGPDPHFEGKPGRANLGPPPLLTRTVYRTDRGGEVRSYESGSKRTITMTRGPGEEVPFHTSMVDEAIGGPAKRTTVTETTTTTEAPKEEKARRRFGFFGRRGPTPEPEFHPDGKGDPDVKHVYQAAIAVDALEEPAGAATGATPAWDPTRTTVTETVTFTERPAHEPVLKQTWRAPKRTTARPPRPARIRKAARKVARKVRKAKAKPRKARKTRSLLGYPGDNHPIIDIEGIGPVYAKRLEKMGIATTGQLSVAKTGGVAKKVKAPAKTVKGWQAQSELLKVSGVGPQYAEAMARAGVRGIKDLQTKPAEALSKKVGKYLDGLEVKVVGQPVTPKRMGTWKRRAARMKKVRLTPLELATPTHGIPPPWLREGKGGKPTAATKGKASRTAPAATRKAKAGKAKGKKGKR